MTVPARLALALASAALMVLSVPTVDLWPLMWVALLPLLHLALTAPTPRRAFLIGWLTGTAANTAAFYWMRGLLERFGHMPAIEALPIMMLLTAYQGLEFALWAWGVRRLHARQPALPMALVAPLVMVAVEILVPQIFPFYLAISQAWVPPVIQIADLTGPVGVTFVMLCVTGGLYDAGGVLRARGRGRAAARAVLRRLALPAALVAATVGYGFARIHQVDARRAAAPHARVGIVQANVGIQEKWDPRESARLLRLHQERSAALAARGADLVVWPESSYPYALSRQMERDFPEDNPRHVQAGFSTPTLFGAVTVVPGPRPTSGKDRFPYNTALMLDGAGRVTGKYDKNFLLVFGEYIPFYDLIPWFTKLFPEASNFNRGHDTTTFPFSVGGRDFRLGPLICYEDILPGFVRGVAVQNPNLLVNITNDAWFGKTSEPYQHLALAVFRSVEHHLDMVRAVNTGVSAHIDAVGRVRMAGNTADPDATPPPPPTSLLPEVALLDRGGLYARVGDLFGYGCLAALAALIARRRGRGPSGGGAPAAPPPAAGTSSGSSGSSGIAGSSGSSAAGKTRARRRAGRGSRPGTRKGRV